MRERGGHLEKNIIMTMSLEDNMTQTIGHMHRVSRNFYKHN